MALNGPFRGDDADCEWEYGRSASSHSAPVRMPQLEQVQELEVPRRRVYHKKVPGSSGLPALGQRPAERAERDGAAFWDALKPHLETLRESICKEHTQVSDRLRKRIHALERENEALRSRLAPNRLAPSFSPVLADTSDLRPSLVESSTTLVASLWRCSSPSRATAEELLDLRCMTSSIKGSQGPSEGSQGPLEDRRSVTASAPERAGFAGSSEHGCVTPADAVAEEGSEGNGISPEGKAEEADPVPESGAQGGQESGVVVEEDEEEQDHPPPQYILWDAWRLDGNSNIPGLTSKLPLSNKDAVRNQFSFSTQATKRHLTVGSDTFVLNPESHFYLVWNLLFIIVLCYDLILFPMDVFDLPQDGFIASDSFFTASFWTADLVMSFFTGYFNQDGQYVCSIRQIALKYARKWFVPDALFCTSDWVALLTSDSTFLMGKAFRVLRITRVLRLLRLKKMRDAMRHLDDFVSSLYFSTIKSIIVNMAGILVLSHFSGCLWFWVGSQSWVDGYQSWVQNYDMDSYGWEYKYVTSLHWSITQFTPGSMHVQPQNVPERTFAVMMLVMGMVIFSSIISNITAATNNLKRITARYDTELTVLRRFFRQESISIDLMARVMRYADNIIKPRMLRVETNDVELIRLLPRPLYMEVVLEIYDQDLEMLPFFELLKKLVPTALSKVCCQCLTPIYLSERAELFSPGEEADAMFFQTLGKSKYCLGNRPRVMLEAQRNPVKSIPICEAVLWTPWHMHGCLVAHTECELLQVNAAKFRGVMASNQRVMPLAQQYSAEFVNGLNKLRSKGGSISDLIDIEAAHNILRQMHEDMERTANGDE